MGGGGWRPLLLWGCLGLLKLYPLCTHYRYVYIYTPPQSLHVVKLWPPPAIDGGVMGGWSDVLFRSSLGSRDTVT